MAAARDMEDERDELPPPRPTSEKRKVTRTSTAESTDEGTIFSDAQILPQNMIHFFLNRNFSLQIIDF